MTTHSMIVAVLAVAMFALAVTLAADTSQPVAPPPTTSASRPAVALPPPQLKGDMSLEEALAARRSVRKFQPTPLTAEQIGQLCWAAQGISDKARGLRTAPSAGATYPLELYVVTAEGVRRYLPSAHALDSHLADDVREALCRAALGQRCVAQAPAVFVIAADVSRTARKYGDRARRYVDIEVGHAAQNLLLQAVALDLGAVPVGAFDDAEVAKALKLPAEHAPLYLIPVGKAAE